MMQTDDHGYHGFSHGPFVVRGTGERSVALLVRHPGQMTEISEQISTTLEMRGRPCASSVRLTDSEAQAAKRQGSGSPSQGF